MRRIATLHHRFAATALLIITALILSVPAFAKSPAKDRVLVKVTNISRVNQLASKFHLNVKKSVARGTGGLFVVEDIPLVALKQLLKAESDIAFIVADAIVPLDGGETVLPLDGGETVLPLDGGETVLPLGENTDKLISSLLDGGETVLPLNELTVIRAAYEKLAGLVTPSQKLLLQAGFRKIGLYPVVGKATGRGVVVADLDTGADSCHEALRGVVLYTFVEGPDANAPENCPTAATVPVPGYGHGTRVASLIRVVAPEATIWAMRVFDNSGSAQISDIYEAVVYAADHGVNVINMSFGTTTPSEALEDAMGYARERGVTLVAAAGNSNVEGLMYPARLSSVKGVVAVTDKDIKATFSNYGISANLAAPGYMWAAHPNHTIAYVAGTSYASPLAAGEAALLIDGYQRTHRGSPSTWTIDTVLSRGVQVIDMLNPLYIYKLGRGRIYLPSVLAMVGI
jgi:subtilisin family serine protease